MQHLTLKEVLALPVVRQADAEVLAGGGQLERGVRWLHPTTFLTSRHCCGPET
jgi:hypothetical protein